MARAYPKTPADDRPEDSPVAWFASMALAIERGDFQRATEAQRELKRLGWSVMQTQPRRKPESRVRLVAEGGGRLTHETIDGRTYPLPIVEKAKAILGGEPGFRARLVELAEQLSRDPHKSKGGDE